MPTSDRQTGRQVNAQLPKRYCLCVTLSVMRSRSLLTITGQNCLVPSSFCLESQVVWGQVFFLIIILVN